MSTRTFLSLKNLACLSAVSLSPKMVGQAGIGADEYVIVDLAASLAVKVSGTKIGRRLQLHVALVAA